MRISPSWDGVTMRATHEIRLSMDVSIGLVFSDLRKDANPGVNAAGVAGMVANWISRRFFPRIEVRIPLVEDLSTAL